MCERLAIVDHGRILAIGSPAELKRRVQTRVDLPARARPARRRPGRPRPAARRRERGRRDRRRAGGRRGGPDGRRSTSPCVEPRRARRRRRRAGRPRLAHRLAADVRAEPRGRLRRARRSRLRRRRRRGAVRQARTGRPRTSGGDPDPRARRRIARAERADARGGGARERRSSTAATGEPDGGRRLGPPPRAAHEHPRASAGAPIRASRASCASRNWLFFEILLPFLTTSGFVFVYRVAPGAARSTSASSCSAGR